MNKKEEAIEKLEKTKEQTKNPELKKELSEKIKNISNGKTIYK